MKTHHGKTIEAQVIQSGRKKKDIAKQLGITRQTLANKLKTPNLPIDFILRIGKILNCDFSAHIPELKEFFISSFNEPPLNYSALAKGKDEGWKDKYLTLLEQYNNFLRQKVDSVSDLSASVDALRVEIQKRFSAASK